MTTKIGALVVSTLFTASAALAQGVAFFSDLRGEVAVDGVARPMLLSELSKGQKITVGRDAVATVMFTASGKEYILKGPAEYRVKDKEVAGSVMPPVERATEWRTSARVLSEVARTSAASVRMRSIARPRTEPRPMSFPDGGKVTSYRPTFRWQDESGGRADFSIMEIGQAKPLHSAHGLAGDSYSPPVKLRPDAEYYWTATHAGAEVGGGRFRTLSSEAMGLVERHRPGAKAGFSDRLQFALLLQELGAEQEAREAWAKLSSERADLPELAALAR